MKKDDFRGRLIKATETVLIRTREVVRDELPSKCRYQILLNQSYDGNPLIDDQQVFPQSPLERDVPSTIVDESGVMEFLWRSTKVPEWINIAVVAVENDYSVIQLRCCGRYSSMETELWKPRFKMVSTEIGKLMPFTLHLPPPPKGWIIKENGIPNLKTSVEKNGKYKLSVRR